LFPGKPEHFNKNDVDYVPSLFAFTSTPQKRMAQRAVERAKRWQSRCYRRLVGKPTQMPMHTMTPRTLVILVLLSIKF